MHPSILPIVIYGVRQYPEHNGQMQIIFNCIFPGRLIQMNKGHEIFCVTQTERARGYDLKGSIFEDLAHQSGDQTFELALALQNIDGLNHLYILQSGFIALGGRQMNQHAEDIMLGMQTALEKTCGSIQFNRAKEAELWMPSTNPTQLVIGI